MSNLNVEKTQRKQLANSKNDLQFYSLSLSLSFIFLFIGKSVLVSK